MKNPKQKQTLDEITQELLKGESSKSGLLQSIQNRREFIQTISTQDICTINIKVEYYTPELRGKNREIAIDGCSEGQLKTVLDTISAYLLKEVDELSAEYQAMIEKENQLSEQLLKDISKEIKAGSGATL